jgi:hypothetical protein
VLINLVFLPDQKKSELSVPLLKQKLLNEEFASLQGQLKSRVFQQL